MIPKVIHYCWFGHKPLPDDVKNNINSWKKYCPDYEIKEWDERNFDINCCPYVQEAYQCKKWAFVSDYARFWILYRFGGIYFDTDVELIKPIDKVIKKGSFMACEDKRHIAPGLGIASPSGSNIFKEVLDSYRDSHFFINNGEENLETIVTRTTDILQKHGFHGSGKLEKVSDIYIYPAEYFCPINVETGVLNITDNTLAIHHYSASWYSSLDRIIHRINVFGRKIENQRIANMISLPFRVMNKVEKCGLKNTIIFIARKIERHQA